MSDPALSGVEGTASSDLPERDTDMTGTYVRVVVLEAVIIAALWMLGWAFS
jgi:hypothetical protein